MKKALVLVMLVLGCSGPAWAAKAKKVPKDLQPIGMKLKWGMVRYSLEEGKTIGGRDLRNTLRNLGDAETTLLIDQAWRRDKAANAFGALGGVGVVWGACALWWGHDKQWNDPEISWPIITGVVLGAIGNAIRSTADSKRFEAVQRYNSVVRGERKISGTFGLKGDVAMAGMSYRF